MKNDKLDARVELDEKGWWSVSIDLGNGGHCITEAKTLKTLRKRLREALAFAWNDDSRAERAEVVERIVVSDRADLALQVALRAKARAEVAQLTARESLIEAAKALVDSGMGVRDAGAILGLSQARIAQLTTA